MGRSASRCRRFGNVKVGPTLPMMAVAGASINEGYFIELIAEGGSRCTGGVVVKGRRGVVDVRIPLAGFHSSRFPVFLFPR